MTDVKTNDQFTPADVLKMSIDEFGQRFGFKPIDDLELQWFAATGKRLDPLSRAAIEASVLD